MVLGVSLGPHVSNIELPVRKDFTTQSTHLYGNLEAKKFWSLMNYLYTYIIHLLYSKHHVYIIRIILITTLYCYCPTFLLYCGCMKKLNQWTEMSDADPIWYIFSSITCIYTCMPYFILICFQKLMTFSF